MIGRLLLCVALAVGVASPGLADGPRDPQPYQHWMYLGEFDGPLGHVKGYTDLSAKNGQPAAVPKGEYLVHFWVILDEPRDTPKGKVAQADYFLRIDCTERSMGDDTSVSLMGADGQGLDYQDSGSTTYSLTKAEEGTAQIKLLDAFCS